MRLATTNPFTWHMRTCSQITDLSSILNQHGIECGGIEQKSVRCPLRRRKCSHSFPKAQYPVFPFTVTAYEMPFMRLTVIRHTHYQKSYIWRSLACGYWNIKIYMHFCDEYFLSLLTNWMLFNRWPLLFREYFIGFDGVDWVSDTRLWFFFTLMGVGSREWVQCEH